MFVFAIKLFASYAPSTSHENSFVIQATMLPFPISCIIYKLL